MDFCETSVLEAAKSKINMAGYLAQEPLYKSDASTVQIQTSQN
jgi:hypothetical protein